MNRICSACNIKIDINNYKKDRTVCKTCYIENKRKNKNSTLPPNIETVNNKKKPRIEIKTETTTLMFQHMKTIAMSLLAPAT